MSESASGDPTITVEIVDDHFLFAQALGAVVGDQPGWTVVGLAVTGPQALGIAKEQQPRVILLDYHLPGVNADVLVPRLRMLAPSAKIVVLTGDTSEAARRNAEAAGANGFLTKDTAIEDVIEMINAVLRDANDNGRPQLAAPSIDPSTAWADAGDGTTESFMDAIGSLLLGAADTTPAPTVEPQADNSAVAAVPIQQRGSAPVEAHVGGSAADAPGGRGTSERTPTERGDELWSAHLATLARLARAEALAVALWRDAALEPFVAWGLAPGHERDWLEGPVGAAANAAFLRRALQHQPRVSVLLADGRIASAALASPVTVRDKAVGVVVALRAGEVFTRADATPIAAIAEAVATALADQDTLRRAALERAEIDLHAAQAEEERVHALTFDEVTRAVAVDAARETVAPTTPTSQVPPPASVAPLTPDAAAVTGPAEFVAPQLIETETPPAAKAAGGRYGLTVIALVLAVAAAVAGFAGLGQVAYLAAAALLLAALLSFHG